MAGRLVLMAFLLFVSFSEARAQRAPGGPRFNISFPALVHPQPVTGRLFLLISRKNEPEVRLQSTWFNSSEMIGRDITQWHPGDAAVVDGTLLGTPLRTLNDVPPGDYYVQAVLSVYTEFHRADGHVLWLHMDQGEGQDFTTSPGNLYSKVMKVHLEGTGVFDLSLSEVIPPLPAPVDTEWVKHIRLQSKLLSEFWGRPMFMQAVVLLPRDYAARPDVRYPVIYYQPEHFRSFPPFEFRTDDPRESESERSAREKVGYENGYQFQQSWRSDHFPRMIAVSIITPTPFSDWSSGMDSANNGPYGRVIVSELIPYIEAQFRAIGKPYARLVTGKHSGGRAALALQLLHPDFFGGVWAFHPWAFDFENYFSVNIYQARNVFQLESTELPGWARNISTWLPLERPITRTTAGAPVATFRQLSQHDSVVADMAGGDPLTADNAIVGPVGTDGYPKPLWDPRTGDIDREVATYWREHGDLAYHVQKNWPQIGSHLLGKLHIYVGEADEFYRNYGVHHFEEVLKATQNPHYAGEFWYGALTGGRQPMTNAELVKIMAKHVAANAPSGVREAWRD